jgi:GH15 family glucan-1,4-alpha-glucosidase
MNGNNARNEKYPPISDYGFIADCHSAALVSRHGSIDWCCMPRIDSRSCFGRLLGWEHGGYCQIVPTASYDTSRRYLGDSLILETIFATDAGRARLLDCFTMRKGGEHHPHRQILRILEGMEGDLLFKVDVVPRFDYGRLKPWIRRAGIGHHVAIGGCDGLSISGDLPLRMKHRHDLEGSFIIHEGERLCLSLQWGRPETMDETAGDAPDKEELDRRFRETMDWWRLWSGRGRFEGKYADYVKRSAIVLKGLTNAPTGAIAAAPTTSLPETAGGSRNWDYRYTWVRDSCLTLRALAALDYIKEADGFRRFIERSAAGSAEQLQILYGVGGERSLPEMQIDILEGYRGAKPVRVGNAAEKQLQLDAYGELLDLSWRWHTRGYSPDDDYWEFVIELVARAIARWREPDRGIWEMRGDPRHFVHSKVMCWAALDRGIRLAKDMGRSKFVDDWEIERDNIRRTVEERGYDNIRGVFIQSFDHPLMDASLLLLPTVGFVSFGDRRMVRTVDAIREDLDINGLLRRYPAGDDGMDGEEGVFLACSFWLAECLANQGRTELAHETFRRALSTGNDLLLFSEEYDTGKNEMLGNFPQGLTHLSLITAAEALADCGRRKATHVS